MTWKTMTWKTTTTTGGSMTRPFKTQEQESPQERARHLADLDDLCAMAGDGSTLAALLGLQPGTVYAWYRLGRISAAGAYLVGRSSQFDGIFEAEQLRPDVDFDYLRSDPKTKSYEERQRAAEETGRSAYLRIIEIIERRGQCVVKSTPRS